tara:strand:- start:136 stop:1335 length:1200 start_codon:yes stop_codon:yes gene_type:complete
MGKIIINERQLEILTSQVLTEQTNDSRVKVGEEEFSISSSYNETGMYDVGKDDPSNFIGKFITGIEDKINSSKELKSAMESGTLTLTKAHITTGASNWYKDVTAIDVENDYKGTNPNLNYYDMTGKLDQVGDTEGDNYKNNKNLSKRRATKFLESLKAGLEAKKVKIFPAIKETTSSNIVDTGGEIDKKRNITKYPNPGQYVNAQLKFIATGTKSIYEEFSDCLESMKITLGYYANPKKMLKLATGTGASGPYVNGLIAKSKEINKGRQSTEGHNCNRAKFMVFLNKVELGVVNLNNKNIKNKPKSLLFGCSKEGSVEVMGDKIKSIFEKSKGGKLKLQIMGMHSNPHGETPWITIVNGKGVELLNSEAINVAGYKPSKATGLQTLFTFTPCKKVNVTA